MLSALYSSRKHNEEGFTLIELLIVVIIIGILAAIALPIFIDQQKVAIDASVQSDVRNSVTNITNAQAQDNLTDVKAAVSREGTTLHLTAPAVGSAAAVDSSATKASATFAKIPVLGSAYVLAGQNDSGKKFTTASGKAFTFTAVSGQFSTADATAAAGGTGGGTGTGTGGSAGTNTNNITHTMTLTSDGLSVSPFGGDAYYFNKFASEQESTDDAHMWTKLQVDGDLAGVLPAQPAGGYACTTVFFGGFVEANTPIANADVHLYDASGSEITKANTDDWNLYTSANCQLSDEAMEGNGSASSTAGVQITLAQNGSENTNDSTPVARIVFTVDGKNYDVATS